MRTLIARLSKLRRDEGMVSAEYAVGTVAACGFGGILYQLLSSDTVIGFLTDLLSRALTSILS